MAASRERAHLGDARDHSRPISSGNVERRSKRLLVAARHQGRATELKSAQYVVLRNYIIELPLECKGQGIAGSVDSRRANRIDPQYEHMLIFLLTHMSVRSYYCCRDNSDGQRWWSKR
jgi:hypothetical protein